MEFITEYFPLLMFLALIPLLFSGYPVAFVLGGTGFLFWVLAVQLGIVNERSFYLVISRIYGGTVSDLVLVAIPMFVFMGIMLERSGIARDLLTTLQRLLRRVPGGLAIAVVGLGVIMAATTGIIGASVVMMTLLALPVMAEKNYSLELATGTIAASGTLGILIPPSIMLVVMGNLLSVPIGTLFFAAVVPGMMLAGFYFAYIIGRAMMNPAVAPALDEEDRLEGMGEVISVLVKSLLPPVVLITMVLGSIFAGFATPTEASGVGAAGATLLAYIRGTLTFGALKDVVQQTAKTGAMLFGLFVGATAFSFVFTLTGGNELITDAIQSIDAGPWAVLLTIMLTVFILGFFFDWIQIALIVLPVFAPIIKALDFGGHVPYPEMTVIWFAILVAVNLQTSFLTPPFGFALFYMKGVAPENVKMQHIYRGILPFVFLQILGLIAIMIWPKIALWLPKLYDL
ncbi:MAG: TRAP transporter large permease subunit [Sphingomonadales bacterium]|nr:TRAP transporter large permease subunit [Sphingomonadales bacterium]